MLVKCVCSNCGHSYLADDQIGDLTCPRCGVGNEGTRNASDIPAAPMGADPQYDAHEGYHDNQPDGGYQDSYQLDEYIGEEEFGFHDEPRFDPQAPPPMVVTNDRMLRGVVFGSVATLCMGAVLGASLAAIRVAVPAALALTLPWIAAGACRYGFGGRSSVRTKGRAVFTMTIVLVLGFVGYLVGSWGVERFTGDRADRTRADVSRGLKELNTELARTSDAGAVVVLEQRISEARVLQAMSDAELEDYLWVQEAQLNQPLLAYGKLRVTRGPAVRFGPESDPVELPEPATAGILLAELIAAVFLGVRGVVSRR